MLCVSLLRSIWTCCAQRTNFINITHIIACTPRDNLYSAERTCPFKPPIRYTSLLYHESNVLYASDRIREFVQNASQQGEHIEFVIGYILVQSIGTREGDYMILPLKEACARKDIEQRFHYVTLDTLEKRLQEIRSGKFIFNSGRIVGLNRSYAK